MIAYKEKYDFSFGYLEFPYSPFNLAVFESNGEVVARPIIDLDNRPRSPFFTYKGQVFETDNFEAREDSFQPDSITLWVESYLNGTPIEVDLTMTEQEKLLFKTMLERTKARLEVQIEEIDEWLLKK
jgi:hypothetical protein